MRGRVYAGRDMSSENAKHPPLRLEMAAGLDDSIYSSIGVPIGASSINRRHHLLRRYESSARIRYCSGVQLVATATVNEAARIEALVNKRVPLHDERITQNDPNFDAALFAEINAERQRIVSTWISKPDFASQFAIVGLSGVDAILRRNTDLDTRMSVEALLAADAN